MKRLIDDYEMLKTQTQFLKMIIANIINRFGDSVDAIAFTWLVFELTHSPAWSTIIFGLNMVPTIFLQPFCGALVEKLKKKNIMVLCDIARGIAVCIIAYCYILHILQPWMLLAITIFNSTVEAFRVPAGVAIIPKLLNKEHYNSGVAMNTSLSRVFELLGIACAGVIIAILGVSGAILIDAITFFLSAFCIGCIHYKDEIVKAKISITSYFVTLKEGFTYIISTKVVIVVCIVGACMNMMTVPMNSFMPAYIDGVLHAGSEMLSGINMSITLGMIVGSFLYPIVTKMITRRRMIIVSTLFIGVFYVGMIYIPELVSNKLLINGLVLIMNFILGVSVAVLNTSISVLIMTLVDENYLARVSGVFGAGLMAMIPIASLSITFALQLTSFISIMIIIGGMTVIFGLALFKIKSLYLLD